MKTITIKPIEGALDGVPKEHLQKWFDALQVSEKYIGGMSNNDDTAHCCLCVSAKLEGYSIAKFIIGTRVRGKHAPITKSFQLNHVATIDKMKVGLMELNDGFYLGNREISLTHPQIAEIIMGREVVLEVAQ